MVLATSVVLVTALASGIAVFGHPFHRLGSHSLYAGTAALKLVEAGGYVMVCLLSVGTIAFALGMVLPGQAEALAASVAFVVIASILDGQHSLQALTSVLPVHYWQRWTDLFTGGGGRPAQRAHRPARRGGSGAGRGLAGRGPARPLRLTGPAAAWLGRDRLALAVGDCAHQLDAQLLERSGAARARPSKSLRVARRSARFSERGAGTGLPSGSSTTGFL